MYYTYVLQSKKDGKWYTGFSVDVRKRLSEHNSGKVFSTKGRGPFTVIYYEACLNEFDARQREKYLKSGPGKRYLKNRLKRFLSLTGFTLVEVVVASAVFLIIVAAFGGAMIYSQGGMTRAGERGRASFLALEGSEATRAMRDASFVALTDGQHGLAVSGGLWVFSGTSDVTGIFTRQVTVGTIDADRKRVTSTVTWLQPQGRPGSVQLVTNLTNWLGSTGGGTTCPAICQGLSYMNGVCRANVNQCTNNGETHEASGDVYCTGGASADTCCCQP
ncbi:MAG: GIY-YIG nuclease family protein [Patescibacteria group bacterium]